MRPEDRTDRMRRVFTSVLLLTSLAVVGCAGDRAGTPGGDGQGSDAGAPSGGATDDDGTATEDVLAGVPATCRLLADEDPELESELTAAITEDVDHGPLVTVDAQDERVVATTTYESQGVLGSVAVWKASDSGITAIDEGAADVSSFDVELADTVGGDDVARGMAEATDCSMVAASRTADDPPPDPELRDGLVAVRPLVRADGWREDLEGRAGADGFPLGEVAYDRETAERAWADNVPDDLQRQDGEPVEAGIYGDLDEIDFDAQAVVVWSSGTSGSCPSWLARVGLDVEDQIVVDEEEHLPAGSTGCTDDYNPYRMLVAVDRSHLPEPGDLPTDDVRSRTDGRFTSYPVDP